jgi:hypothetical protein
MLFEGNEMLWTKAVRVFVVFFTKMEYCMQPDYDPETVRITPLVLSYFLMCIFYGDIYLLFIYLF